MASRSGMMLHPVLCNSFKQRVSISYSAKLPILQNLEVRSSQLMKSVEYFRIRKLQQINPDAITTTLLQLRLFNPVLFCCDTFVALKERQQSVFEAARMACSLNRHEFFMSPGMEYILLVTGSSRRGPVDDQQVRSSCPLPL